VVPNYHAIRITKVGVLKGGSFIADVAGRLLPDPVVSETDERDLRLTLGSSKLRRVKTAYSDLELQ